MASTSVCYTCLHKGVVPIQVSLNGHQQTLVTQIDDGEIPMWFKQAGIYSPLAPVFTRDPSYNWFNQQRLQATHPKDTDYTLQLNVADLLGQVELEGVQKDDTYLGYWAARPRSYQQPKAYGAIEAYGDFSNSGMVRVDPELHTATVKFHNPEPYHVDGEMWPPHLHFTLLRKDRTWSLVSGAIDLLPIINREQLQAIIANQDAIVVNALPEGVAETIPGTLRIPYDYLPKQILSRLDEALATNPFQRLASRYQQTNHIPIVVYCKDADCGAASALAKRIRICKFPNVIYYPGGTDEYLR